MKTDVQINKSEKSYLFRFNKHVYVYLISVLLASLFWFLNALEKTYFVLVHFPVTYTGIPAGKMVLNELPPQVKIQISGKGFNLLPITLLNKNNKLSIDFSQVKFNKKSEEIYRISASDLIEQVKNEIPSNVKINTLNPDTIFLHLNEKYSKTVPVKPLFHAVFKDQFSFSDTLKITPSHIKLYGPKKELDKINALYTDSFYIEYPEKKLTVNIGLQNISGHLELETNKVEIVIPIEKLTEKKIRVPVQAINLPDTIQIKTFPQWIELSLLVPLSKYDAIDESQIELTVDYLDYSEKKKSRLLVKVQKKPEFVIINHTKPEKVEFIVKRK
ncbi:MAG: hypothetical protein HND27_06215 [Bacteroidetes bacterium]|nr:hypothetical protein [Flavobacteriales bacterium]MCL4816315.1 hypothetical protein [Flavobacteriales bacterium]NOG95357.1 hypothetical protein [Bacteroidota bacterium]WKZ76394.1 MAG: hypothetical protein QY303_05730 [Vicingaceae bacterium]CAG0968505.1 hypothetical protein FLAV_01094 [Flavobacteriales bacterium]